MVFTEQHLEGLRLLNKSKFYMKRNYSTASGIPSDWGLVRTADALSTGTCISNMPGRGPRPKVLLAPPPKGLGVGR
jgi:hypothetical protein